jgi:Flp pilus assembly protein TadG
MMNALKRMIEARLARRGEEGQTQVEFILTVVFLVLLLFGIIEIILMIYTYNVLADSAKEGVRYAVVHGCDSSNCSGTCSTACSDAGAADVVAQVKNYAKYSFHDTSVMTVSVNYPDASSDAPNRVQVTVSYPYQPFFGFSWPKITVNAAAEGRISY